MRAIIILSVFVLFIPGRCALQNGEISSLKSSYLQARAIVEDGIRAIGGLRQIQSLKAIGFDYEGKEAAVFQGPSGEMQGDQSKRLDWTNILPSGVKPSDFEKNS